MVGGEHAAHRGHRGAAGQRQPELLVFVRGGDELVGVRLDADGDAHEHVLHDARGACDLVETLDLGHRVQHDVPDAGLHGRGQLVDGFVVAVQSDSLGREVRRATRRRARRRCRRPAHSPSSSIQRATSVHRNAFAAYRTYSPPPKAAAISRQRDRKSSSSIDEDGRAELGRDIGDGDARDRHHAVVTANGVARPHVRRERQHVGRRQRARRSAAVVDLLGVPGAGGVRDHIRSGAVTPRMPRPLAMTWRVASHSASRAECRSFGASSPCGRTRQES